MQQGIDKVILETLRLDARTPLLAIARKLNVSEGTVRNRVKKMVASGVIARFTVELGGESGGVEALVGVRTQAKVPTERVVKRLRSLAGVGRVYEVAGQYDVIVFARADNLEALNDVLERVRQTPEVLETESFTVLKRN